MRQGLVAFRTTGQELWQPYFLALLAEGYGVVGQPKEGLAVLAESLVRVEKTGERWYEAELHRLKGQLLLQQPSDIRHRGRILFSTEQLKLPVTNKPNPGNSALPPASLGSGNPRINSKMPMNCWASVYGWFTEGFDTADFAGCQSIIR